MPGEITKPGFVSNVFKALRCSFVSPFNIELASSIPVKVDVFTSSANTLYGIP